MPNQIRLASKVQTDSIVDGPGLRIVIWTQGCLHACPGCHNPQTHALDAGDLYDIDEICELIKNSKLQHGVTLSGGEPFLQAKELIKIAKTTKELNKTLWAYSGFTYEQILADKEKKELLEYLDVLVDSKFILAKRNIYLNYKGSSNQRIIDVQASLEAKKIIRSKYDDDNLKYED